VGIYFTALLGAWLIGGCFMAYAFSAAGPVFASIFDPSLAERFRPLRDVLAQTLGNRSIGMAQQYLVIAARETHVAVKGGGISAMPSMHIATVTIYVLAARGTKWLLPACLFWILIFIGSGYFGFHYWADGLVGAAVSVCCWQAAVAIYARLSKPSQAHVGRLEPAVG
jgi:membrane-associated phospholipid phosphatase